MSLRSLGLLYRGAAFCLSLFQRVGRLRRRLAGEPLGSESAGHHRGTIVGQQVGVFGASLAALKLGVAE
jgi:hypothetical protein